MTNKNNGIGSLPVRNWRISEGFACTFCNAIIEKGFPYLEEDWYESVQNFCVHCAIDFKQPLVNNNSDSPIRVSLNRES